MATQTVDGTFATVNPYTNETVRDFESLDADHVDATVEAAHAAFLQWRLRPVQERAAITARAGVCSLSRHRANSRAGSLEGRPCVQTRVRRCAGPPRRCP